VVLSFSYNGMVFLIFVLPLPSCVIKHTNLNKTAAVHTVDSANRLNNSNSQL
jgi:hypothetical protein